MRYLSTPPELVAWTTNNPDLGPVFASRFGTDALACHLDATPGARVAKVTAGTNLTVYWAQEWPITHRGPLMDYLAPCPNNDCTKADRAQLKFFKIDEVGLLNKSVPLGFWANDVMFQANRTWTVQIPASIAPGQYVLRHEVLALHESDRVNGTQAYPQCFNLDVQGGTGSQRPEGVLATALYQPDGPGMDYDIYNIDKMPDYQIPGPPVFAKALANSNGQAAAPVASAVAMSGSGASFLPPGILLYSSLLFAPYWMRAW